MGDDGAMAKGAGCTPEFRAKAVGLLTESRGSCSSETRAVDGRRGRGGDQAVGRGCDGGVEGFAGRGRAIGARERDIDGGVGFFRGQARPGTALTVACVDGFRDRFGVGPAGGAPAGPPGCGFVTPCG